MVKLQGLVKKLARGIGCDLRRYRAVVCDPYIAQQQLLRSVPCRTIFDIGAFQGEATTRYSELFPSAEIYAFEPFPPSYEALTAKFSTNSRIHLVNAAISARAGQATFHVNGLPATNSLLPRPTSGSRYFPAAGRTEQTITVTTTSLDDYREQQGIKVPEIIKMDIQGNELQALRGAEKTLATGGVALIFTEVMFVPHYEGGVLFNELALYLADRGFSLFNLFDLQSAVLGQLRFGDAIFVSENLRKSVIDQCQKGNAA
jgi:FkbM family methyltransferase